MSTLSVDTIQGQTTAANVKLPAGCILQVIQGTTATQTTHDTSSYTDTTLTATITPKYNTSKVYILVNQASYWTTNGFTIKILRGSTDVSAPPINYDIHDSSVSNARDLITITHLDNPTTTSATTYKTQLRGHSSGTFMTQDNSRISTITLMEVAQ